MHRAVSRIGKYYLGCGAFTSDLQRRGKNMEWRSGQGFTAVSAHKK